MRWLCFEIQLHKYEKEYSFLGDLSLIFSVITQSISWISLTLSCLTFIQMCDFIFFLSKKSVCVTHYVKMVSESKSKNFKTKCNPKQSSFAWMEEHHLACRKSQGRQTFPSVSVSKINTSGTTHSVIAQCWSVRSLVKKTVNLSKPNSPSLPKHSWSRNKKEISPKEVSPYFWMV